MINYGQQQNKFSPLHIGQDRIEYDVTRLKYLTYMMASVRLRACLHVCAVEIKQGMLRAACFDDVCVWTCKRFALQDFS